VSYFRPQNARKIAPRSVCSLPNSTQKVSQKGGRVSCLLACRLIGIIEGEQGKKKQRERNDRIVAVEADNHSYAHVKHIRDLGKAFIKELEEFFVDYHRLSGKQYRILGIRGPREAKKHVKDGVKEAKQGA